MEVNTGMATDILPSALVMDPTSIMGSDTADTDTEATVVMADTAILITDMDLQTTVVFR